MNIHKSDTQNIWDEAPITPSATLKKALKGSWLSSRLAPLRDTEGAMAPVSNLIKSSGIYALSSVTIPLISLLLAPFLTHSLSPNDYGILTVLNTTISLGAGITQLGLGSAFFRAYGYDYTSTEDRRRVLGTTTLLLSLITLPVVVGIAFLSPLLAQLLFRRPVLSNLIILAAGVVLLQNLTIPGFSWLRAENRALFYSLLSIGNLLVALGANILFIGVLHLGLAGALLATGSGYASVLFCTLPLIFRRAVLRLRADIVGNLLGFGVPLVFNFVSYWILQLADRYLLGIFSSFAETARYAVAYTLGSAMSIVVIGPFTLAWPAAIFAIAKREDAAHVFTLVFRWFSLLLLFAAFAMSLVGTILLNLLFPVTYHSGATIIPVIAGSIAFYGIYHVFGTGINITRKTWWAPVFLASGAFVNVALNVLLIPHYGAMGAAVSTFVAYVVLASICYIVTQRLYPVPFEISIFTIALVLGIALYAGSAFLGKDLDKYVAWAISVCALLLYGGCLVLIGMLAAKSHQDLEKNKGGFLYDENTPW